MWKKTICETDVHIGHSSINYNRKFKSGPRINMLYIRRVKMSFIKEISALQTYWSTLLLTDTWMQVIWLPGVAQLELTLDLQKAFSKVSQKKLLTNKAVKRNKQERRKVHITHFKVAET